VQAYGYAGHLALARQYAHRLLAAAADRGDPYEHAWVLARLAAVEVAAGDLTAAQRYATEAYRLPDRTDAGGLTPALAAASLAPGLLAAVHRHDLATADRLAARLDAIYPEIATLGLVAFEADRARAWWRVQHGAHVAAHELLVDRAERWLRNGGVLPVVLFASDLARTGAEAAATQLVDRLPPPESWPLGEALVRFVRAVHARAGAELAAVASVFDRLGCRLYAAEAAAAAMPRRDRGAARAALLVAICGNPRTPLVAGVRGESCALTGREREVAALAAGGLPNQAIADRLTLSVRTVENHLNRAFAKLGIGRRTELAGLLEDRADAPASTVRR
jgi:DNA-binding CsgD family transcriptional regulator